MLLQFGQCSKVVVRRRVPPMCVCVCAIIKRRPEALFLSLSLVRSQFPFQGYKFVSNARAGRALEPRSTQPPHSFVRNKSIEWALWLLLKRKYRRWSLASPFSLSSENNFYWPSCAKSKWRGAVLLPRAALSHRTHLYAFHCAVRRRWVRKAINGPGRPQYILPRIDLKLRQPKTFIVFAINLIIFLYIKLCWWLFIASGDAQRTARAWPTQSSGRWHYKSNDWWSILWYCALILHTSPNPVVKKDHITR